MNDSREHCFWPATERPAECISCAMQSDSVHANLAGAVDTCDGKRVAAILDILFEGLRHAESLMFKGCSIHAGSVI